MSILTLVLAGFRGLCLGMFAALEVIVIVITVRQLTRPKLHCQYCAFRGDDVDLLLHTAAQHKDPP